MDGEKKIIGYDIDGKDTVTARLRALVNSFPGRDEGESILFAELAEKGGKAMYPGAGAAIESETRSVTGRVRQVCLYPFVVGFRASGPSEERRAYIKEWLDALGQWLERQQQPTLDGGRKFIGISRTSPAYLDGVTDDLVETWAIALTAKYENIFFRR